MRFLHKLFGTIAIFFGLFLGLCAVVGYTTGDKGLGITVGVFSILLVLLGKRWRAGEGNSSWRDDPATEKQKSFADDLGIKYHKGITKGELSDRITKVTGK